MFEIFAGEYALARYMLSRQLMGMLESRFGVV